MHPKAVLTRPLRDATFRAALAGGGWTLAGAVVGRATNAIALLYAAAQLGSEGFGELSLVLSTVSVVTSISALGLPVAATKLVAEARVHRGRPRERLVHAALILAAVGGLLAALTFLALSRYLADTVLGRTEVRPLLAVAAPLVLLIPSTELVASLLTGLERFRSLAIYRALHGVVPGSLLALVLAIRPGATATLGALVVGHAVVCGLGLRLLAASRGRAHVKGEVAALLTAARKLFRVSLPAVVASASLQPALWIGQVVLSRQPRGLQQLGVFAVAYRWHVLAIFVPATLGAVLLPILGRLKATGRQADARALLWRYAGMTLVLSVLACLALVLFSGMAMRLPGAEYAGAAPVLTVLAVAVVPAAMNNVLSQRSIAEDKLALWVWSDVALAGALAGAALVLVPMLGATGLAWSYLIAYVVTCAVLLPVLRPERPWRGVR
jgi:O-antigen/teichoic acid export membrane protein